jgi:hypothetical protein
MFEQPQAAHQLLDHLVGKWTSESECIMGPDQPPIKTAATAVGRSLGGMWIMLETESESPEGGSWNSVITLGYDSQKSQYVGTFIASMMSLMWLYTGQYIMLRTVDWYWIQKDPNGIKVVGPNTKTFWNSCRQITGYSLPNCCSKMESGSIS